MNNKYNPIKDLKSIISYFATNLSLGKIYSVKFLQNTLN